MTRLVAGVECVLGQQGHPGAPGARGEESWSLERVAETHPGLSPVGSSGVGAPSLWKESGGGRWALRAPLPVERAWVQQVGGEDPCPETHRAGGTWCVWVQ